MNSSERIKFYTKHVAAHEKSGLSVTVYCNKNNVGSVSFYQWRKRLQNNFPLENLVTPVSEVFKQVKITPCPKLTIEYPDGLRVYIEHPLDNEQISELLQELRG